MKIDGKSRMTFTLELDDRELSLIAAAAIKMSDRCHEDSDARKVLANFHGRVISAFSALGHSLNPADTILGTMKKELPQ